MDEFDVECNRRVCLASCSFHEWFQYTCLPKPPELLTGRLDTRISVTGLFHVGSSSLFIYLNSVGSQHEDSEF